MTASPPTPTVAAALGAGRAAVQRRTLTLLFFTQIIGGVGVAIGIAVGALLAARMGGTGISGLAQSALVVGAALLAVPVTRLMRVRGRRPGLVLAYLVGVVGALVVVAAAKLDSVPLLCLGLFLFGGGNSANYQARYAAVDLAPPASRGRQLSIVVWATTIGAVAGPNLASAADDAVRRFGAATYSGPFAFSALAFALAALILGLLLRPDPLLLSRIPVGPEPSVPAAVPVGPGLRTAAASAAGPGVSAPMGVRTGAATQAGPNGSVGAASAGPARAGIAAAAREVIDSPAARLGVVAIAMGHALMVAVMAMTPVHIGEGGHGDVLRIVGIVLSAHIAGMYAFSLVTGWLTDKAGRRPVILTGVGLLLAACAVAGTAGHDTVQLSIGLVLLGMGWSCTMVAGSTLLTESVGVANRPSVQGLSDLVMGVAAALAGALSGVVVAWSSYATLTMLAAVATVPLIGLALRPVGITRAAEGG